MVYHEDLISRIRSIMQEREQSGDDGFMLITDGRLRLDDYISDAIAPAVSKLQGVVRGVNVVSIKSEDGDFLFGGGIGSGSVIQFGGFYNFDISRYVGLYRLSLSGWGRAATMVHSEDSEVAKCQYNEYTRAKADKPVVVELKQAAGLGESDGGKITLLCYPAGVKVSDLQVEVSYDTSEGLRTNSEKVIQAVSYMAAGIVYNQMRMADAAALMAAEADAVLKR